MNGCSGAVAQTDLPAIYFALDVSESSKDFYERFAGELSDRLLRTPRGSTTAVFRFDSAPAEIHSGAPPETLEEAAHIIKKTEAHSTETDGTNLAKLFDEIDKTQKRVGKRFSLVIFTDCGIEKMTGAEKVRARELVNGWEADGSLISIQLVGIRDGWREPIREILQLPDAQLEIR